MHTNYTVPSLRNVHLKSLTTLGLLFLYLLIGGTKPLQAQEPPRTIHVKYQAVIAQNGTAHLEASINFSPASYYDVIKSVYPDLYLLFRDMISNDHAKWEVNRSTVKISWDDANQTIHLSAVVQGFAYSKDNQWQIPLSKGESLVTQTRKKVFSTYTAAQPGGTTTTIGAGIYILPAAADNINFDPGNKLTYTQSIPHHGGSPQLSFDLLYHKRIMASVYKIYADPNLDGGQYWVAKSIVTNNGSAPMYDVKIYYSLGEYADSWTPEPFSTVLPGGAAVDCYYPLISSKVSAFKTENPAHLTVRVVYKDAAGHVHQEEHTKLVSILGINQLVSSNLSEGEKQQVNPIGAWMDQTNNMPLVAAYVTKTDDPVKQLAGWISSTAGGVAASDSDKDALTWLKAAYDTEQANNIVYQTPSGFLDGTQYAQDVKFPRDTLRAKSGTCIDLAILLASLAEAVGMQASLMVVPGHCFPVIQLPSGQYVGIESTGLQGGTNAASFDQVLKRGSEELVQHLKDGRYHLVNIDKAQGQEHITPPDLPTLGANFLTECGIHEVHYVGGGGNDNPPQGNPNNNNPPPNVAAPPLAAAINATSCSGTWKGYGGNSPLTMHMNDSDGVVSGNINLTLLDGELFQAEFRKSRVRNGEIDIAARGSIGGQPYSIRMKGRRNGGIVTGSITLIERGPFDIVKDSRTFAWKMVCTDNSNGNNSNNN